ncbi:hypothetical protein [Glycomyces albidus]|jgi:hypothetical protein|nr:hypothetical protein [Glycomyces albidus]
MSTTSALRTSGDPASCVHRPVRLAAVRDRRAATGADTVPAP